MNLIRADILITRRKKADSREKAAKLICDGLVLVNGKPVAKPATLVPQHATVTVHFKGDQYVSRGGEKLAGALDALGISPKDKIVLDCGSATGGFTDCLLRRGATKVYAVDVGYGQLHWKLRNDPRVIVMERTNLRYLDAKIISPLVDIVTLDMSFISLRLIFDKVAQILKDDGLLIAMIKPQFEAGKENIGSKGVIRDPKVHRKILLDIADYAGNHGWAMHSVVCSSLKGPKGNREFFFYLTKGSATEISNVVKWIDSAVNDRNEDNSP